MPLRARIGPSYVSIASSSSTRPFPAFSVNETAALPEVRLDHARVRLHLRRRLAVRDLRAVVEDGDRSDTPITKFHVVLDEEDVSVACRGC